MRLRIPNAFRTELNPDMLHSVWMCEVLTVGASPGLPHRPLLITSLWKLDIYRSKQRLTASQ